MTATQYLKDQLKKIPTATIFGYVDLIDKDKNGDTYVKKGAGITLRTKDGSNKPYLSQCCNNSYPSMRSSSWLKTNKSNVTWYVE